ncbi:hypothetical protein [Streptomyces sp. NPDC015125]|uniref:hypothetical protein n=1 Tax=Streptomyces sp. NPDC015125 TaxID=3364938 RepID=UPI0036F7BAC6
MNEALDALEREMTQLRALARTANANRNIPLVRDTCEQLRLAEDAWHKRLGQPPSQKPAPTELPSLLTAKEQLRRVLQLIGVPAVLRTIRPVNRAFFESDLPWPRLASLRRDEERRYTTASGAQSYICPALHAKSFTPVRGFYALSDWPLEQRLLAPHSERRDFLTMATRIASDQRSDTPSVQEFLRHMAREIPGALPNSRRPIGPALIQLAEHELRTVAPNDQAERTVAARTARQELAPFQQIFGVRPQPTSHTPS